MKRTRLRRTVEMELFFVFLGLILTTLAIHIKGHQFAANLNNEFLGNRSFYLSSQFIYLYLLLSFVAFVVNKRWDTLLPALRELGQFCTHGFSVATGWAIVNCMYYGILHNNPNEPDPTRNYIAYVLICPTVVVGFTLTTLLGDYFYCKTTRR